MKQKNKKEVSFFRLKLESYMSEHHPERLGDKEFFTARADMALTAYCDAVAQGFNHLETERIASEVLFSGLHFSKYDTLVSVLEKCSPLKSTSLAILSASKWLKPCATASQ